MPTPGETLGDALEKVARLIPNQIKAAMAITPVVETMGLYLFEDALDIREGNPEDDAELERRIWVVPGRNDTDLVWSSATSRFVRRFEVGIGTGRIDTAVVHLIEGVVTAALAQLHHKRDPSGAAMSFDTAPLVVESILIGSVDHEREPILDPEEVQAICEVTIVAHCPFDAIAPAAIS